MSLSGGNMAGGSGDLLEVLRNPEVFRKRLEQLEEVERRTQAVVDLAGPADEIVRMRDEIGADREAAELALIAAHAECERLISEAGESARNTEAEARTKANGIMLSAEETKHQAEEKLAAATAAAQAVVVDRQKVVARTNQLNDIENALQQKTDALASREQEFEGEKEKLAEIRELIHKVIR